MSPHKSPIEFSILKKLDTSAGKQGNNSVLGRAGILKTKHGDIETPAFVTVGTKATVKALTTDQVKNVGSQVVLGNTYHLYLEPGEKIIKEAGGIHKFMNWTGPTMTDSGGFQVFSLGAAYGKNLSKLIKKTGKEELILESETSETKAEHIKKGRKNGGEDDLTKGSLAKIDEDGVMFRSHIDGSAHYITPEKSIDIQNAIGADIIFAFDECTSPTETFTYQRQALDRTHRWAKRCLKHHHQAVDDQGNKIADRQALFGVIQGGREEVLRKESASFFAELDFDGFGIGGSFAKEDMEQAVKWVNGILPEHKPRHLLGIGEPEDLFMAVEYGCDLFDCVAPTRIARNGQMYTKHGKINILNEKFKKDFSPIEHGCECDTCKNYTRAYVAHLFRSDEMLGATLASTHNLYFINKLVKDMRQALLDDVFYQFKEKFFATYPVQS